jgi:hypothetical protein
MALTKAAFAAILEQVHMSVFDAAATADPIVPKNRIEKIMDFYEKDAQGQLQHYAAVLCERPYSCLQMQRALQREHNMYVSFGASHSYFWTMVVYGSVPSGHKSLQQMDSAPYHSQGKTLREELADIPRGARLSDKQRVRAFLGRAHLQVHWGGSGSPGKSQEVQEKKGNVNRTRG